MDHWTLEDMDEAERGVLWVVGALKELERRGKLDFAIKVTTAGMAIWDQLDAGPRPDVVDITAVVVALSHVDSIDEGDVAEVLQLLLMFRDHREDLECTESESES